MSLACCQYRRECAVRRTWTTLPLILASDTVVGAVNDYDAFDRFGRTARQQWVDYTGAAATRDQFDYKYNYAGNRTSRDIPATLYATNDRDEVYSYDGLQRLSAFDEGTLSGTPPAISGTPTKEEDWTLDALGNWGAFIQKASGTTTLNQSRAHNKANEIDVDDDHTNAAGASITASAGVNWYDPTYDGAGNMTSMPRPSNPEGVNYAKYDAWNRLVEVSRPAGLIQKNKFDGLHRRIVRSIYTAAGALDHHIHYYYNQAWQVVEERKEPSGGVIDTDPINQYVWHPDYIDALAMRRHDGNVDGAIVGAGEGKHYYLQDANYNVTAVVNDAGSVVERYAYTPYGTPTILNGAADADAGVTDFSVDANQQSDISNVILYTGRERDPETGLQLNRNRFYASHLGRWLTRDPIGYLSLDYNLYSYVGGRPTRFEDPFGLEKWPAINPFPQYSDHWNAFNKGCIGYTCLRVGDPKGLPFDEPGTVCYSSEAAAKAALAALQQGGKGKPCMFAIQSTAPAPKPDANGCVDPACCMDGSYNFCTYHQPENKPPYWEWGDHGSSGGTNPGNIFHNPKRPKGYPTEVFCVVPDCACPSKRPRPEGPWWAPHGGWGPYISDNPSYDPWLWIGHPGWEMPPSLIKP